MTVPGTGSVSGTPQAGWRPLLRDVSFLRLWTGTTASRLATWALPFVLGLAVVDDQLTSAELGVILAARTVGFLAAVPLGGVLADRYPRRAVIVVTCLTAAVATPVMAAGLRRSEIAMAVAAVAIGAGQGASRPAFQALVADVVDASGRQHANAAITFAAQGSVLVAPGATALFAAVFEVEALVVGTGLLWFAAAVAPRGGRPVPATDRPRRSFVGEMADGLREARRHPWYVATLLALTAVIATGYSVTGVMLPLLSKARSGGAAMLTAATTASTAGALIGSLFTTSRRAQGWIALAGLGCYGLAPAALMLPVHWSVPVVAYGVVGAGFSVFHVRWFTAEQTEIDRRLLGRVSSLSFLLAYGLAPVGLAAIGPAVEAFGAQTVLGACALTCILAPAAAAFVPSSRTFSRARGTG